MEKLSLFIQQINNEKNIEALVEKRKEECMEENKDNLKQTQEMSLAGIKFVDMKIGPNRIGPTTNQGGYISASSKFIEEDRKVNITNGIGGDIIHVMPGNLDDVYIRLLKEIKEKNLTNLEINDISNIVYGVVNDYFGLKGNVNRAKIMELEEGKDYSLDVFKGKNIAACSERALLSQNLFKILGIDSTLKESTIERNGKREIHAYNIIRADGRNYIYDPSLPKESENKKCEPIIGEISDEEYMLIINGREKYGCRTKKMDNNVVYDSLFGTVEEELSKLSPEEILKLKEQAGTDNKINMQSLENDIDEKKDQEVKITSRDIAEADKEKALTSTELSGIKSLINKIKSFFLKKGKVEKKR